MKKTILAVALMTVGMAGTASADSFVNGGFETGDLSGWTTGGGKWTGSPSSPVPPSNYTGGTAITAIMNSGGTDVITGINTVYNGQHSVRLNNMDASWNGGSYYDVSTLTQKVLDYSDNDIYFQWNAVLQSAHGAGDSSYFSVTLRDLDTSTNIVSRYYDIASAPSSGAFRPVSYGYYTWYTTDWVLEHIDLTDVKGDGSNINIVGHDLELTVLASDCPYGGHAGYVYLDGFAPIIIPPGTPEPASLALLGLGLAGLGAMRRRQQS